MTSFDQDIRPLFRDVDVDHMKQYDLDLSDYDQVKYCAKEILDLVKSKDDKARMPPPPDPAWSADQVQLFQQWIDEGFPA